MNFKYLIIILAFSGIAHAIPVMDISLIETDSGISVSYYVIEAKLENYSTSSAGDYEILIYDSSWKVIFQNKYTAGRIADIQESLNITALEDRIPYSEKMKILQVRHNGDTVKTVMLNLCNGNNLCDGNENALTCPKDCRQAGHDNLCISKEDGKCDPDCLQGYDKDCRSGTENFYLFAIIGIVLLIGFIFHRMK